MLNQGLRARVAREGWIRGWSAYARYHRYEVEGLEHLDGERSCLIVGYHGRPFASDQCMLTVAINERYGYMPHGLIHGSFESPGLRWIKDGLGFVCGDGPEFPEAITRGEHFLLQPGGTREACRSHRERYTMDWGRRRGYARLALRYSLPVVVSAASGVDDTYISLVNGYQLGKRVKMPLRLPLFVGVGPLGLWPFSPPFPVKFRQRLGAPIPAEGSPDDPEAVERLHERVSAAMQRMLDDLNQRKSTARSAA